MENRKVESVEVAPFESAHAEAWDAFVDESANGTLFHRQAFLRYHRPGRFDFQHLIFRGGKKWLAVLPGGRQGDAYKSPLGATFGSFVTAPSLSLKKAEAVVQAFLAYCQRERIREVFFTPPMPIYHGRFDETMEYVFLYNGFRHLSHLLSSVVDLKTITEDPFRFLSPSQQQNVARSRRREVRVERGASLDQLYPILVQTKEKYGVKPVHTLEELKDLTGRMPGRFEIFMAFHEAEALAGIVLFLANENTVLNFYTAHLNEKNWYYPCIHVLYESLKWAWEVGYRYYDYGVSMDTLALDPMAPQRPLVHFKEGIGARGCMRHTYYRRIM